MTSTLRFSDLLAIAIHGSKQLKDDDILSLVMPIEREVDPLDFHSSLGGIQSFRFLWDRAPGQCISATGHTKVFEYTGLNRFDQAQHFVDSIFSCLVSPQVCPSLARPKVLLAFSFFDTQLLISKDLPGVQAVLPTWQLSRQKGQCWLRLQRTLGEGVTPNSLTEELWEQSRQLVDLLDEHKDGHLDKTGAIILRSSDWEEQYRSALKLALELVESKILSKIVLAARQELFLDKPIDLLQLIRKLRISQRGSCRFLWQKNELSTLFGASPERLISLQKDRLKIDALAGSTRDGPNAKELLSSQKNRLEHELVVDAIAEVIQQSGLVPRRNGPPRNARHGALAHLHTLICADMLGHPTLPLAGMLHPTPAVAGVPRTEAANVLRHLEPFERGLYAAPIGWIDSDGDAELRVAIRSGSLEGNLLQITAGAGLIAGSIAEQELNEVELKLGVIRNHLTS